MEKKEEFYIWSEWVEEFYKKQACKWEKHSFEVWLKKNLYRAHEMLHQLTQNQLPTQNE